MKHNLPIDLHRYKRGREFLHAYKMQKIVPDLIYLDMLMEDVNGHIVAQELRQSDYRNGIIFLFSVNSVELYQKAIKCEAMDVVIKNETDDAVFEEMFLKAFDKFYLSKQSDKMQFTFANTQIDVEIDKIRYFEYHNHKITVYYNSNESFTFYNSLKKLEEDLCLRGFLRLHNAFLVHMNHIGEIKRGLAILKDGKKINFNKDYTSRFKQQISEYKESVRNR